MKVAIATEKGQVASHFGRCEEYIVYEIKEGEIVGKTSLPNPGHAPGIIPNYLAEHKVSTVIAGGMGPRAQDFLARLGIQSIIGVQGNVESVIQDFLAGKIKPGENVCDHNSPEHKSCH